MKYINIIVLLRPMHFVQQIVRAFNLLDMSLQKEPGQKLAKLLARARSVVTPDF